MVRLVQLTFISPAPACAHPIPWRRRALQKALLLSVASCCLAGLLSANAAPLPKVRVAEGGRTFMTTAGQRYSPFGVTYFRPGTGWAPQVWKQFDAEATRADFTRLKASGVNVVRVFLTLGSFLPTPDRVDPAALGKLDRFLDLAEEAGLYVHPTGPDHWEGIPAWAKTDPFADERFLEVLERFWKELAAHCRGRSVIFAYDLLNEPAVGWDGPVMRQAWNRWLAKQYPDTTALAAAWHRPADASAWGNVPIPAARNAPRDPELLDYQRFREALAVAWTERQVRAIKSADPAALVTIGLIQWSIPAVLGSVRQYAAFRPQQVARFLDFTEVHFYPLDHGFYEYQDDDAEARNLAYLESVVTEAARTGQPVVLAEFGWYGGGQLTIDKGVHRAATEEQQARWCRRAVESTQPWAAGWLNWGYFDQPEATDVSQLIGLAKPNGQAKAWGREFQKLARGLDHFPRPGPPPGARPVLDWDLLVTDVTAGQSYRDQYLAAWKAEHAPAPAP